MQTNLLTNPYLYSTLEDLLFEKQSVLQPIVDNPKLSPTHRLLAMTKMVQVDEMLGIFTAAVQADMEVENATGAALIEQCYGKSIAELSKAPGLMATAGKAVGTGAKTAKSWLNKGAAWLVEKTK